MPGVGGATVLFDDVTCWLKTCDTFFFNLIARKPLNEKKQEKKTFQHRRWTVSTRRDKSTSEIPRCKNGEVSWSSLLLRRKPARVSIELDSGQVFFSFQKSKVSLKTCNFAIIDNGSLNAVKVESELIGKKKGEQQESIDFQHMFLNVLSRQACFFFEATKLTFLCK